MTEVTYFKDISEHKKDWVLLLALSQDSTLYKILAVFPGPYCI